MLFTTKATKNPKRVCQYVLSFLRDLRVLRGKITYDRLKLELSRQPRFPISPSVYKCAIKAIIPGLDLYTVYQQY